MQVSANDPKFLSDKSPHCAAMSRTRVGVSTNITLLEEGSPRNEPRIDVVLLAIISETRNEGVQCVFEAGKFGNNTAATLADSLQCTM